MFNTTHTVCKPEDNGKRNEVGDDDHDDDLNRMQKLYPTF